MPSIPTWRRRDGGREDNSGDVRLNGGADLKVCGGDDIRLDAGADVSLYINFGRCGCRGGHVCLC